MTNVRDRMFDSLVVRARLYRSARMQHPHRRAVGCALVALTLLGCETVGPGRSGGGSGRVEIVARLTATSPGVRIERSGQPKETASGRDPARTPRLTSTMATPCT